MEITHVNGQALADLDLRAFVIRAEGPAYASQVELRQRSRLYPVVEDITLNESERTIYIEPVAGSIVDQADLEAMNLLVRRVFAPSLKSTQLTGTWNGSTYQNQVWFRGDARPQPGYWEIDVLAAVATWESTSASNHMGSGDIAVGGNAYAQPTITITSGDGCTRHRIVVSDNTAHGIGSYMIAVSVTAASENNVICYHNGFSVPFFFDGSRVYLRVGARVGRTGIVDIYAGAGVDNQTGTANGLDDAGLTLDSDIASGLFKPDVGDPFEHPKSAALSWHPEKVVQHESSRSYDFGWDGSMIRMVDRESTGVKVHLENDMDAVVLTSPVGLQSIDNLEFTLRAGYRGDLAPKVGVRPGFEDVKERVQRITMAQFDGAPAPENSYGTAYSDAPGHSLEDPGDATDGGQNFPWYVQWTFGDTTFPATDVRNDPAAAEDDTEPQWYNVADFTDFVALVTDWIGVPITTGDPGVYYLHFEETAFSNLDEIPLLRMSISGREIERTIGGDIDFWPEDAGPKPAVLFESIWVDPETLEPIDEDAALEAPVVGRARVCIWSRARDSEVWTKRWSSTLSGTNDAETGIMQDGLNGVDETLEPGPISLGGHTQVAIGLEPVAANANEVEWAELEIGAVAGEAIEVLTVASQRPTIATGSVAAQHLDFTLTNDETGESIEFSHVYSDATGLEINTSMVGTERAIQGAGGVGPWYGEILPSGGTRLFDLAPDVNNALTLTDLGISLEFDWRDRVAW